MSIINESKSKLMHIKLKVIDIKEINLEIHTHICLHTMGINCQCPIIEQVEKYTYLGIIIEPNVNFELRITERSNKFNYLICQFHYLSKLLNLLL
jgi:hypothetical protein